MMQKMSDKESLIYDALLDKDDAVYNITKQNFLRAERLIEPGLILSDEMSHRLKNSVSIDDDLIALSNMTKDHAKNALAGINTQQTMLHNMSHTKRKQERLKADGLAKAVNNTNDSEESLSEALKIFANNAPV